MADLIVANGEKIHQNYPTCICGSRNVRINMLKQEERDDYYYITLAMSLRCLTLLEVDDDLFSPSL